MPSTANEHVLDREFSIVAAKGIIEVGDPLLLEIVNYSTSALLRCATSKVSKEEKDRDLACLALYRQILEFADEIQCVAKQSISAPAKPILRTMFEAYLSLKYILESNKHYRDRALAWLVGYSRNRLFSHEQMSSTTTQGKQFRKKWRADTITHNIELPSADEVKAAITNMEDFLSKPHIAPVNQKFEDYKTNRKRKAAWYSLDGGPDNLEQLSEILKCGGLYEIFYRPWSSVAHAEDLLGFIAPRDKKGDSGMRGLRSPDELKDLYAYSCSFLVEATKRMLTKFRPGESGNFANWYKVEVKSLYEKLTNLNVTTSYIGRHFF